MQFNNVFKDWLNTRKITEDIQNEFGLLFDEHIIIPVYDEKGEFLFNKYRRNPLSEEKPKYWYDKGGRIALYGYHKAKDHKTILITEGEMDCLVAWSHNIPAVTSTGGAMSFQDEWGGYFDDKEVIICFDNDDAGVEGMIKTLKIIPHAKILFLPDQPNLKDISDYVSKGGNLHELLKTAVNFGSLEDVHADRLKRLALCQNVLFHNAYIKEHTKVNKHIERKTFSNDRVTNARLYPIGNLLTLKQNKCLCPFHKEKTPSFTYYPKTNTAYCFGGCGRAYDVIDVYRAMHPNKKFIDVIDELNKLQ